MKKKILGVFISFLVVAMLALPMSTVFAKNNPKFEDVNGKTLILGGGQHVFTPAGNSGNVILVVTGNDVQWTDDLAGTGTADGHFLLHKDGSGTSINIHTLTDAEYDGNTGTLTIITVQGKMQTHWRIIGGTGGLAGLHGGGTWWPDLGTMNPFDYFYSGYVHFDP